MKSKWWPFGKNEPLTAEMCAEIARLGLDRQWFEWLAREEGLDFCKFCLAKTTKSAEIFEYWYPRLTEFVAAKRRAAPWPTEPAQGIEAAVLKILEPKILAAEHVPCKGDFTAAIFTAPLHVLPLVATLWPATYRYPVFLAPDEWTEWRETNEPVASDFDAGWIVTQEWTAELNPPADSFWLRDVKVAQTPSGQTPVMIRCGMCWGSLAGGDDLELWIVDATGNATYWQDLGQIDF